MLMTRSKYISYGLGALFALRVAHAEHGMVWANGFGIGRAVGYYGTEIAMATLTGYLAYLVKDYVQM
jgi:hypothetical protein